MDYVKQCYTHFINGLYYIVGDCWHNNYEHKLSEIKSDRLYHTSIPIPNLQLIMISYYIKVYIEISHLFKGS